MASHQRECSPNRELVAQWVVKAFESLSASSIINAFRHIGYTDKVFITISSCQYFK
jgi:hypothetical protein